MAYQQKHITKSIPSAGYTREDLISLIRLAEKLHSDCVSQFKSDIAQNRWHVANVLAQDAGTHVDSHFALTIAINGHDGEYTNFEPTELNSTTLPSQISKITISNFSRYEILTRSTPSTYFEVVIDFKAAKIFDLVSSPSRATENQSLITSFSINHIFCDGMDRQIESFFRQHKNLNSVVHRENIYDFILWFLYLPIVIILMIKHEIPLSEGITSAHLIVQIITAVTSFALLIICFRLLFNAGRWLFPFQQITSNATTASKISKLLYSGIVITLVGVLAVRAIEIFWSGLFL